MRPTDILRAEHRVIEQVLYCLETLTDRACINGWLDGSAAGDALDFLRHFADECHHAKEEECLFPALEARGMNPAAGPTAVMREEHHRGRQLLHEMEANRDDAAVGDPDALARFAESVWEYIHLLREHIAKEDNCLFPMAERALDAAADADLCARFEAAERHDRHPEMHERYVALADELAERLGLEVMVPCEAVPGCVHARA
jgi:hemerythrin-like domain-containing protein